MVKDAYSIAVFPYLKTSTPVRLGDITFRSTLDTKELTAEQAAHVETIANMLFLQDNWHIRAATYAIVPGIDLEKPATLNTLRQIQAVVAYCYTAPHPTLGHPFLHYEHASLLVFTPGPVIIFLVQPSDHVDHVGTPNPLAPNDRHEVPGYAGIQNFAQPFWVANGSRLYPPVPHLTLNNGQDLAGDLQRFFLESATYHLLPLLLRPHENPIAERASRAINWFNKAHSYASDQETSIVALAIAFETLLGLPVDQKTNRLTDAIALLLGRLPRLDLWADQFYSARSSIVHTGEATQLRFAATDDKKATNPPLYHSLLAYGRQVFQLCVATLLAGAHLAARAGLAEKLVTNQERFAEVCKTLSDTTTDPATKLLAIAPTLRVIEEYRFVAETNLRIETMLDAARLAAKAFLAVETIDAPLQDDLQRLATTSYAPDGFAALEALATVTEHSKHVFRGEHNTPRHSCLQVCDIVWHETFMHYYWRKQERTTK